MKKGVYLGAFLTLATPVAAAPTFTNKLSEWIIAIFGATQIEYAYIKIILFILMFAVFHEAAIKGLPKFNKKPRMVIALILSFISTVFMSESVVAAILQTYGAITAFALIAVPIAAVVYLIYFTDVFKEDNRMNYAIKFALTSLLAWIFWQIGTSFAGEGATLLGTSEIIFTPEIANFSQYGYWVTSLMSLWYAIFFVLGPNSKDEPKPADLDSAKKIFNVFKKQTKELKEFTHDEKISEKLTKHIENLDRIKEKEDTKSIEYIQSALRFISHPNTKNEGLFRKDMDESLRLLTKADHIERSGNAILHRMRQDMTKIDFDTGYLINTIEQQQIKATELENKVTEDNLGKPKIEKLKELSKNATKQEDQIKKHIKDIETKKSDLNSKITNVNNKQKEIRTDIEQAITEVRQATFESKDILELSSTSLHKVLKLKYEQLEIEKAIMEEAKIITKDHSIIANKLDKITKEIIQEISNANKLIQEKNK